MNTRRYPHDPYHTALYHAARAMEGTATVKGRCDVCGCPTERRDRLGAICGVRNRISGVRSVDIVPCPGKYRAV